MTGTGKLLHQVSHKILLYRPILQLFQNFVTSLLLGWRTVLPHVGEEHGIIRESQMSVHLREILPAGFYQSVEITRTASLYHIPERIQFRHPGCIQILLNGSPFPGCQILFFKRRPSAGIPYCNAPAGYTPSFRPSPSHNADGLARK